MGSQAENAVKVLTCLTCVIRCAFKQKAVMEFIIITA